MLSQVYPGDPIFAEVYTGDSSGTPKANGAYAWYWEADYNPNRYVQQSGQYLLNLYWPVNGFEADWIVERPAKGSTDTYLYNLARFASFTLGASVGYSIGTSQYSAYYSSMANVLWQMFDSNHNLAIVVPVPGSPSSSMLFTWFNSR
jgi:hypothetical protein